MSNNKTMKVCPNGHYYEGEECPYCPNLYGDDRTKVYPYHGEGNVNIPTCPHCGRPIRKRENLYQPAGVVIGSISDIRDAKMPWNYNWNGRCDSCGHDFNINMTQNIGYRDLGNKHTSVKVSYENHIYSITAGEGEVYGLHLSGVEIETYVGGRTGGNHKQKVFLSTNELKYLLKVLANSPILQQEDCEWLDRQRWRTLT